MGEGTSPGSGPGEDRRSFEPSYCPSCGYELLPPGEFCSHCGAEIPEAGGATEASTGDASRTDATTDDDEETPDEAPRAVRGGETQDAFRRRVSDWIDRGWSIERDYGQSVVLIKRDLGNVWVHLGLLVTTVWFTTGLVNAGYALWSYIGKPDRVTLHRSAETAAIDDGREDARTDRDADSTEDRPPAEREAPSTGLTPPTEPGRPDAERPANEEAVGPRSDPERTLESVDRAVGVTLVLIAAGIVALGGITPGSVLVASLVLLAAGICFPSIRRNVRPTHSITTFGPTKSTEEHPVENPGRPCTVCGSAVDGGTERTYREEIVAAGVGLYTTEEGRNYYCESCSTRHSSRYDPAPAPDEETSLETDDEDRETEPSVESASE